MTRLAQQLSLNGHVIADSDDYDVAIVCIEPSTRLLPGKPFVHRVDGIWFSPHEFQTKNVNIKRTYEQANHIVFQSNFDQKMVEKWWGVRENRSVIRNGIDLTRVSASNNLTLQELRTRYKKICVCASNWHPQKRLRNNVEVFKHIRKTIEPYSCLVIMGANPDYKVADANIYYTGSLPHELCLEMYSVANWMIHTAWLSHCDNVCIEALSQGCPVICSESGGTAELVGKNGIVLKEKSEYSFELLDYDSPPPIDVEQIKHLPDIEVSCPELDIRLVANAYEKVLKSCLV